MNHLTCAFSCRRRCSAAKLTALNLASIAAIIRLMMAHVAVTMRATKNQMVYSDITRCVNIITLFVVVTVSGARVRCRLLLCKVLAYAEPKNTGPFARWPDGWIAWLTA